MFNERVSKANAIFTGGKSAIDLYGPSKDGSLNLFELKRKGNVQLGIISELFFYSTLINDVRLGKVESQHELFREVKSINAFFMAPRLHPLLTDKVLKVLNSGGGGEICYRKLLYSAREDILII